jgi:hypothetical protein|tara:strand:- start:431 stop:1111 length:681 start_codon:yes stop_codon:yes gene_type:complete
MAVVTPDLAEIFEDAYERAGLELRSGYDLKTIRRSLNFITLEWQNRGLNLWTVTNAEQTLTAGTASYTFTDTSMIDVIEMSLRTGTGTDQVDNNIQRISVSTYSQKSNKNQQGRPTQAFIQRLKSSTTFTLYPVPDSTETYKISYFYLAGVDGLSSGISGDAQIPSRFVPCLVAGLAYYVAMKKPEASERVAPLKAEYEFQYALAAQEDRDRSSSRFVPMMGFGVY